VAREPLLTETIVVPDATPTPYKGAPLSAFRSCVEVVVSRVVPIVRVTPLKVAQLDKVIE